MNDEDIVRAALRTAHSSRREEALAALARREQERQAYYVAADGEARLRKEAEAERDRLFLESERWHGETDRLKDQLDFAVREAERARLQLAEAERELNEATKSTGGWREYVLRQRDEAVANGLRLTEELEQTQKQRDALAKRRSELRRLQTDLLLLAGINNTPGDWGALTKAALDVLRQRSTTSMSKWRRAEKAEAEVQRLAEDLDLAKAEVARSHDAVLGLNVEVKRLAEENEKLREELRDRRDFEIPRLQAEVAGLRAALDIAKQHIKFNRWMDDPGSDRRYDAVKELEALEGSTSEVRE